MTRLADRVMRVEDKLEASEARIYSLYRKLEQERIGSLEKNLEKLGAKIDELLEYLKLEECHIPEVPAQTILREKVMGYDEYHAKKRREDAGAKSNSSNVSS